MYTRETGGGGVPTRNMDNEEDRRRRKLRKEKKNNKSDGGESKIQGQETPRPREGCSHEGKKTKKKIEEKKLA